MAIGWEAVFSEGLAIETRTGSATLMGVRFEGDGRAQCGHWSSLRRNTVLLDEGDGLRVSVASSVGWSEAAGRREAGGLLESLRRGVDLLILRTDLWQQERTMLSDGRPGRRGQLSVD